MNLYITEKYLTFELSSCRTGAIASHQVFMNHTGDEDLKKFLEGLIENDMNSEIEELKALLKINGVALPPAPPNDQLHLSKTFLLEHVLMMLKLPHCFYRISDWTCDM